MLEECDLTFVLCLGESAVCLVEEGEGFGLSALVFSAGPGDE